MIRRFVRTAVLGAAALALVATGSATAYADDSDVESAPPQWAMGHFGTSSTRRPPCNSTSANCTFSLVASGTTVGLPGSPTSYCHDPGYSLPTTLNLDCFVKISGTLTTRQICQWDERIFASLNATYRSSTGRQFDFIVVVSMVAGYGYFDGSAIDTTTGAEAVYVSGVLDGLCYTPGQGEPTIYPEWGMKGGKIQYTHVET